MDLCKVRERIYRLGFNCVRVEKIQYILVVDELYETGGDYI